MILFSKLHIGAVSRLFTDNSGFNRIWGLFPLDNSGIIRRFRGGVSSPQVWVCFEHPAMTFNSELWSRI